MDASRTFLLRKAVAERLAQVPDDSVQAVLAFMDDLIEQHEKSLTTQEAEKLIPPEEITTWEQWFSEVRDLPEIPALVNLTKQQRQKIITDGLVEEYERQSVEFSPEKQ
jgi:hypothetical protein